MTITPEPTRIVSPTFHVTVLLAVSGFVSILMVSIIFKIEIVARGQGRVVPVSRVQVVQPEFAGQIAAIHARNGMSVARGAVLIELDATDAISDLGVIRAERDRLRIETVRIDAMAKSADAGTDATERALSLYELPQTLASHPFASEQRALLLAEASGLKATLAQLRARKETVRRSEAVTNASIARVTAALGIQSERLLVARQLLQKGTTSRARFLDVQQVHTELERERDVYLRELEQKSAEHMVLDGERRRIITELRNTLLTRKAEIDSRLAILAEDERAARRRVQAAILTAPASGIVDQLAVFTVGGIAEAGAELLRIVPDDARIEIEAIFPNQDIGFLKLGQQANIRLDAYPAERFGFVKGKVSDIAADSVEVSEGQWGYTVRVSPEQPFLNVYPSRYSIRPGMTATIDVTTDRRRIISYFFAPIVRTVQDALGER